MGWRWLSLLAAVAVLAGSLTVARNPLSAGAVSPGCSWSSIRVPLSGAAALLDVAAVAPDDVWMIGWRSSAGTNRPVVLHYDGSRLRVVSVPLPPRRENALWDIGASAGDDIWLSGDSSSASALRPLLLHWNGEDWRWLAAATNRQAPNAKAFAVTANGPADAWLVGRQSPRRFAWQGLIEHWNGRAWRIVSGPARSGESVSTTFVAVAAVASDDVWAGGAGIGHWDGRAWRMAFTPNRFDPETAQVTAISASDSRNVWFVGEGPLVARFDGEEIREVPIPAPYWGASTVDRAPWLSAITAFSPRDVWVAGGGGILHYDGSWRRTSPITTIKGLSGLSAEDLWAVGGYGRPVALHRHC